MILSKKIEDDTEIKEYRKLRDEGKLPVKEQKVP